MAYDQKDLPAVDDAITIDVPQDRLGVAGLQYISGTGTVVMEASNNRAVWYAVTMTLLDGVTTVTSLAAVGIAGADVSPYRHVRARKSSGTSSCIVGLSLNHSGR